jgi:hypothetical protein
MEEADMTHLDAHQIPAIEQSGYATAEDFSKLLAGDPNHLYLLTFLLTANHEKAEQCFVAGLNDFGDGNAVFQEWAGEWARQVIVRNAIRIVKPQIGQAQPTESVYQPRGKSSVLEMQVQDVPFASILSLNDFERFVYVLSVLERFSDQECAVWLGISRKEVRETRTLALKHVSDYEQMATKSTTDPSNAGMS